MPKGKGEVTSLPQAGLGGANFSSVQSCSATVGLSYQRQGLAPSSVTAGHPSLQVQGLPAPTSPPRSPAVKPKRVNLRTQTGDLRKPPLASASEGAP